LTPAQMMQVAGDSWVPADGRKVSTQSPYAIETGSTELPDLRGVFARGLNQFDTTQPPREAKYLDPETRKLAAPQEDAFREHLHTVGAGTTDVGALSTGQVLLTAGKRMPSYYGSPDPYTYTTPPPTSSSGDKETRPKNVALYYYIKIK